MTRLSGELELELQGISNGILTTDLSRTDPTIKPAVETELKINYIRDHREHFYCQELISASNCGTLETTHVGSNFGNQIIKTIYNRNSQTCDTIAFCDEDCIQEKMDEIPGIQGQITGT